MPTECKCEQISFKKDYYPNLFPDNVEHKHKKKNNKKVPVADTASRYSLQIQLADTALLTCLYQIFWATKILPQATRL